MTRTVCLVMLFALSACGSSETRSGSSLSDGSIVHTLSCDDSWADCYRAAEKVCGARGFDELDRAADGTITATGRLARMHSIDGGIENHVYAEDPREAVFNRVVTIRCRTP